jgi:hypothetical protein
MMTKKELAYIESLKIRLALRFTEDVNPDIPKPVTGRGEGTIVNGWSFNSYSMRVYKSCSSSTYHGTDKWNKTESQEAIEQYSTPLLACRAMRREVEERMARELRKIDAEIERLSDDTP